MKELRRKNGYKYPNSDFDFMSNQDILWKVEPQTFGGIFVKLFLGGEFEVIWGQKPSIISMSRNNVWPDLTRCLNLYCQFYRENVYDQIL